MRLESKHIEALNKAEKWMFHSDFCPYLELKALLPDSSSFARNRFCTLFTNYYALNTGGLTDEFKKRYFEILFEEKIVIYGKPVFCQILTELSKIKRKKGDYAIPFSFVSKLVAMHLESSPIYDKHVLAFFGEKALDSSNNIENRIGWFVDFLDRVHDSYEEWAKNEQIVLILNNLKARDEELKKCHPNRLMDFLVWKVGNRKLLT